MKPLTGCALFGATRALKGIRDVVVLQHSVIGCNWGSIAMGLTQCPDNIHQASTVIYDNDVIGGGDKVLQQGLQEVDRRYPDSKGIFVISGCVPNMIGEDVEGVIAQYQGSKSIWHICVPGYGSRMEQGAEAALLALGKLMELGFRDIVPRVNIIGIMADDPCAAEDVLALQKMWDGKVQLNCSLHNCSMAQIANMPEANLNLVFGCGLQLAQYMERRFGTPYLDCDYPYGIHGAQSFLEKLGFALSVDLTAQIHKLEAHGAILAKKAAPWLKAFWQMPVGISADRARLAGLKKFFHQELGTYVAWALDTDICDLNLLEEKFAEQPVVVLLGSSLLNEFAVKEHIPLMRVAYPAFDELCLGEVGFVGIAGTGRFLEKLINAALQLPYKEHGLYEGICKEDYHGA